MPGPTLVWSYRGDSDFSNASVKYDSYGDGYDVLMLKTRRILGRAGGILNFGHTFTWTVTESAKIEGLGSPLEIRLTGEIARARSDAGGRFRYPALPRGHYMILVTHPEHGMKQVTYTGFAAQPCRSVLRVRLRGN